MNTNIMDRTLDELSVPDDELYHHGVVGMKWGVRRTPAQLGHKPSGKKKSSKAKKYVDKLMEQHRAKSAAKKAEKAKRKAEKKAEDEERKEDLARQKKPISKMSDTELAEYNIRKANELRALQIDAQISQLQPQKVSKGNKFAEEFKSKTVNALADGASNMVKNFMQNAIDKALGQGAYSPLAKLKKEAEKAGYEKVISEAKNAAEKAKFQEITTANAADKRAAEKKAARDTADEAARKANEERSQREYDSTGGRYSYTPPSHKSKYYTGRTNPDKVYVGEIVDDYRSSGQSYVSGYLSAPASSNRGTIQLGQSYIAGYLPAPKDDD